jgi:hypothetical protein
MASKIVTGATAALTGYGTAGTAAILTGIQPDLVNKVLTDFHVAGYNAPLFVPAVAVTALSAVACGPDETSRASRAFATAASFLGIFAIAGALTPASGSVVPAVVALGATALSGAATIAARKASDSRTKVQLAV